MFFTIHYAASFRTNSQINMSFPALLEMPKMLSDAKKKGSADKSPGAALGMLKFWVYSGFVIGAAFLVHFLEE